MEFFLEHAKHISLKIQCEALKCLNQANESILCISVFYFMPKVNKKQNPITTAASHVNSKHKALYSMQIRNCSAKRCFNKSFNLH